MPVKLKHQIAILKAKLEHFLFGHQHLQQLGVFRFILCGTLFYIACFRQLNIDQYGPLSLIPRDAALNIFPDYYRPFVQWFFWPDSMASAVHLGLIVLLFLGTIGLINRPLMLLTWIIHQGFLNRNYSMLFGADVIGGLFLFYLSFTKSCEFFSLKNVLVKKNNSAKTNHNISLSAIFFRLMQVQICTIYMYTGFEKLKGTTWWDGTALWTVFANPQFSQFDLKFLSHFPIFFAVGTFVSIVFEIYFPAMMLNKKYRNAWLLLGVSFHLGIGILLGLMPFSMVMMATYVLFLPAEKLIYWIGCLNFNSFKKS